MSTADTRVRQVLLVIVVVGILIFFGIQARNFLVQKIYQEQLDDIENELHVYKELNEINNQMWSEDNNLKQTVVYKNRVEKLSPASKELEASKRYLLDALGYIYLAQEKSGLSISKLNLEDNQPKLALPKEYFEKANEQAARSTAQLKKFEETHKELFQ